MSLFETTRLAFSRAASWVSQQTEHGETRTLLKGAAAIYAMQLLGFGLLFVSGLLLGRWLGAAEFGLFSFAITIIIFLRFAAALGFPMMLLKNVAAYNGTGALGHLKGLARFSLLAVTLASIAIILAGYGLIRLLYGPDPPDTIAVLILALPLIFTLALTDSRAAIVRGLDRVALGQVPDLIVRPIAFLVLLAGFMIMSAAPIDAENAILLRIAAETVALGAALWLVHRYFPPAAKQARPAYDVRGWTKTMPSFVAIDAINLIYQQTDILILAYFATMADVGVYRMAANLAMVVSFASVVAGAILAPVVARAWAQNNLSSVQMLSTRMSRVAFLLTLIVYLGLMAISPLIVWFLGPEFKDIYVPLALIGLGFVVRSLWSAAPTLTLMTGAETTVAIGIAVSAAASVALNIVLVPSLGPVGAALTSLICTSGLIGFYAVVGYRRTGVHASIFGRPLFIPRSTNGGQ